MSEPHDEPFDWEDKVRILDSNIIGSIVAVTYHMRREPSYIVEYLDANGTPHEREWSHTQLRMHEPADARGASADDVSDNITDNVVPLKRNMH